MTDYIISPDPSIIARPDESDSNRYLILLSKSVGELVINTVKKLKVAK